MKQEDLYKILEYGNLLREDNMIKNFSSQAFGIDKSKVEVLEIETDSNREEFAKKQEGMTYYYYSGPRDDKNRAFCAKMLDIDKVFPESDIEVLSIQLGYDVQMYKGSYNCRHKWIKFRGKEISGTLPTNNQIDSLVRKQEADGLAQ